jgi:predicted AlkP superfamily phosphohydrolase/phosphomutase
MMCRSTDPQHPAYDEATDARYRGVLENVYGILDDVVGHTMEHMPPGSLLVVMSDHGFASWRRVFHLNTWLKQNGYLTVAARRSRAKGGFFPGVDWSRSRAYGLGLNALYINLRGRERTGIVEPGQRQQLMEEIAQKLLSTVDPVTQKPAITKVYRREQIYPDGRFPDIAPDLVVGYTKGTRGSNESALGEIPDTVFSDNDEAWSGDHCMDHETVPGILLANRPLKKPAASLEHLAASLLAEFGITGFPTRR